MIKKLTTGLGLGLTGSVVRLDICPDRRIEHRSHCISFRAEVFGTALERTVSPFGSSLS